MSLGALPSRVVKTSTWIDRIPDEEHRMLCGMVHHLIPTLKWRHNGLGLLQAYVQEGTSTELRIHVWHPSLRREGIVDSGLLHDHRFDLTSYVLVGQIIQREYELFENNAFGTWQLHEVVHAREASNRHGTNDGLVSGLPTLYHAVYETRVIQAGDRYKFPKEHFHGSFIDGLAVTVVRKSNQTEKPARILAPYGKPVVHAFAETLPEEKWAGPLEEARVALWKRWSEGEA